MCPSGSMLISYDEFKLRNSRFNLRAITHLRAILNNHVNDNLFHHAYDFFTLLTMLLKFTPDNGGIRVYFGCYKNRAGKFLLRLIYCPTDNNRSDIPGYYHYCDDVNGFGHYTNDADALKQTDFFKNNVAKPLASLIKIDFQTCSVWYPKNSIASLQNQLDCWRNNNINVLVAVTYFGSYATDDPGKTYITDQIMPIFFFQTDENSITNNFFQDEEKNGNIQLVKKADSNVIQIFGRSYNDTGLPCPPATGCPK